jgi:hypothetical protein
MKKNSIAHQEKKIEDHFGKKNSKTSNEQKGLQNIFSKIQLQFVKK